MGVMCLFSITPNVKALYMLLNAYENFTEQKKTIQTQTKLLIKHLAIIFTMQCYKTFYYEIYRINQHRI